LHLSVPTGTSWVRVYYNCHCAGGSGGITRNSYKARIRATRAGSRFWEITPHNALAAAYSVPRIHVVARLESRPTPAPHSP